MNLRASFTLIELLVVIAIVAILSVVVILAIQPAELLRQSRDSVRMADLATLNRVLNMYQTDVLDGTLGAASTTYFSLIDSSATTTAGTDCSGVGRMIPPTGWSYHCAASSTYRKTNGTGWMPVNFGLMSTKSPLSSLPVDPTNTSSSGNYYSYTPGGSWALSAMVESQKYLANATNDGGYDPGRIEVGTNLALIAKSEGLVGWWNFEEGNGTSAGDMSGNGNNGTWYGSGTHYAQGKVGSWAGQFNGTDDYLDLASLPSLGTNATLIIWLKAPTNNDWQRSPIQLGSYDDWFGSLNVYLTIFRTGRINWADNVNKSAWNQLAVTSAPGANDYKVYENAVSKYTTDGESVITLTYKSLGGGASNFWSGLIDDVRIYNRALSAAEIQAIYNSTK